MPHDPLKLLRDIADSAAFILEQTRGRSLLEYEESRILRNSVEREFIIIGEALNRLVKVDSSFARSLGNYPQIKGFRNIVVHGYDAIDHAVVWGIVMNEVPRLLSATNDAIRMRSES